MTARRSESQRIRGLHIPRAENHAGDPKMRDFVPPADYLLHTGRHKPVACLLVSFPRGVGWFYEVRHDQKDTRDLEGHMTPFSGGIYGQPIDAEVATAPRSRLNTLSAR